MVGVATVTGTGGKVYWWQMNHIERTGKITSTCWYASAITNRPASDPERVDEIETAERFILALDTGLPVRTISFLSQSKAFTVLTTPDVISTSSVHKNIIFQRHLFGRSGVLFWYYPIPN
jgi:hypothetical protein